MVGPSSVRSGARPNLGCQALASRNQHENCGATLKVQDAGPHTTMPSRNQEPQARDRASTPNLESEESEQETGEQSRSSKVGSLDTATASGKEVTTSDLSMADNDWTMEECDGSVPDPLIGLIVARRYRILECIGRGGMGVVYRVEHTEIGKLLALKLLAGELSRHKEVVRRFKREALLASRLTHPNSVQVFDFGVSEGLTYLVMELVVGRNLSRMIRPESMDSARLTKIMVQVCSSLSEAHGMGIVHRDIKPENIVVAQTRSGGDFVKVLDFGLAKLREASDLNEVTMSGQVVGTPFYMAPEQIHGNPVDGRADIYSLGAVMYEALTGEPVFRGPSPIAVFTKHLTKEPIPPRQRNPDKLIAPALEQITMRCLKKAPEDRFQRIEDLQEALLKHLGGSGHSEVESLINSTRLQALQVNLLDGDPNRTSQGDMQTIQHPAVATRDEVTAFKRKLRRQRWVSFAIASVIVLGFAYGGIRGYQRATAKPAFNGFEEEPNNQAPEATDVPFGQSVQGMLGKRIGVEQADRDFYRIVLPPDVSVVSVTLTALPNMATCLWLYKEGDFQPQSRYCIARPGKQLSIPALRLDPAPYLFAVMQDRQSYDGGQQKLVVENVSDPYKLTVSSATPNLEMEIEPNDSFPVATPVAVGATVGGRLNWHNDTDEVCAWPRDAGEVTKARFVVSDAEDRTRDLGAVLEVTQMMDGNKGRSFRLHRPGATPRHAANAKAKNQSVSTVKPSGKDFISPWRSDPFETSSDKRQCLKLRLTTNPWAGNEAPLTPPISPERWKVRVEKVD